MKRKRHTEAQIIAKLRQAEAERASGATIEAIRKRLEISTQTIASKIGCPPEALRRLGSEVGAQ